MLSTTGSSTGEMMFYILNGFLWPSIVCTLFLFYHFIRSSHLRNKPRNRIVLCLLIVNFIEEIIELPPRLYVLYMNTVPFPNPIFCQFCNFSQYTLVSINQFIMAIASIEQYLFIFNRIFLSQHIFLLRRLPRILCILVPTIFYGVSVYVPSCTTIFDYTRIGCGLPCFFSTVRFAYIFKNIIMNSFPVIVVIVFDILITIRVFVQRRKMKRQRQHWYENIRMISQLLPFAVLYLIIWVPTCIIFYFISLGTDTQKLIATRLINDYFGNLRYLINFFCPFLILIGQPELHEKVKKLFFCSYCRPRQHTAVVLPMPINK